jgi:hypothetical protein
MVIFVVCCLPFSFANPFLPCHGRKNANKVLTISQCFVVGSVRFTVRPGCSGSCWLFHFENSENEGAILRNTFLQTPTSDRCGIWLAVLHGRWWARPGTCIN